MSGPKKEAKNLLVESLKLYVTLSVACLAGLFAHLSTAATSPTIAWFWGAVIAFVICAVISIYNINYLVKETYDAKVDIYKGHCRLTNTLAIITFVAGVVLAGVHFLTFPVTTGTPATTANQVTVGNTTITIGANVSTKVRIVKDTKGNLSEVTIN